MMNCEGAKTEYGIGNSGSFLYCRRSKKRETKESSTHRTRRWRSRIVNEEIQKPNSKAPVKREMWIGDLNSQEGDIVINTVTQIIRTDVLGSS